MTGRIMDLVVTAIAVFAIHSATTGEFHFDWTNKTKILTVGHDISFDSFFLFFNIEYHAMSVQRSLTVVFV